MFTNYRKGMGCIQVSQKAYIQVGLCIAHRDSLRKNFSVKEMAESKEFIDKQQ